MSTSRWDRAKVALDDLGSTPGDIALTLMLAGCRGYRKSAWDGPLARYLRANVGIEAGVWTDQVSWIEPRLGRAVTLPMTQPLREFLRRFDEGSYPQLEVRE